MKVKIYLRYSQILDLGEYVIRVGVFGMRMHSEQNYYIFCMLVSRGKRH